MHASTKTSKLKEFGIVGDAPTQPLTATPSKKKPRLFPLHMTSFEHYMFVDDRPAHPMTFVVQLHLSGQLDREAFTDAVEASLTRHPLLTAIIGPGKGGKDCWLKAKDLKTFLDWGSLDDPMQFPNGEFIDLRKETGLRIFVRHDGESAIITAQFHHATCDGIGSYQYLGDLLFEYAIRTGASELPPLAELPFKRLKDRGRISYDMNNFRTPDGKLQKTWGEALKFMRMSNVALKPEQKKEAKFRADFPSIESFEFDKAQYKALRHAAQENGQIINDMLLEKLFQTLSQWESKSSRFSQRRHVCVMMPMNLREPTDNDISACNAVSQSFVRYHRNDLKDSKAFRSALGNEVLKLKHDRARIPFMHMMAGGHYFYPKTLKFCLDFKKCLATAILSNTGDPTKQFLTNFPKEGGQLRCGNLLLTDVAGVPPMRPGTNATISIFTYKRLLKICVRCDPNQFSKEDTRQLLEMYVDNIRE
ncbi:chromosome condensation protein [Mariniblastus sp.]|nr:chromosome condensation protein [Mariniblastus sp.]